MKYLKTQPLAESGIMNLRLIAPKLRTQPALNLQMVQLQFNHVDSFGKIPSDILCAHKEAGNFAALDLRLDHHSSPRNPPRM